MKPIASLLLAALLLGASPGTAALADSSGVIAGDNVIVCSDPGGPVAGRLSRDDVVTITGEDGGFYRVKTDALEGYVYRDLVRMILSEDAEALRAGDSGSAVAALQTRLRELGYYIHSKITGYYGPETVAAVRRFEERAGLAADGVADTETQAALCAADSMLPGETVPAHYLTQPIKIGTRGPGVCALQARLQELGCCERTKITGFFDDETRDALLVFQRKAGLPETGKADPATLWELFGVSMTPGPDPAYSYDAMRIDITLRKGRSGDDVRDMQTALAQKGYYMGPINGVYDSDTLRAVTAFQRDMDLRPSGLAGNYTLCALYSLLNPPLFIPGPGRHDSGESLPIEKPGWSEASKAIPRHTNMVIVDIQTGYTLEARRTGGTRHADIEPLHIVDTATLYTIYGNQWSWERRPIWVVANGRRMAASMNGMPHGYDTVEGNEMRGQICVHFVGSRTHNSRHSDPDHQRCINQAYEAGLRTAATMPGP